MEESRKQQEAEEKFQGQAEATEGEGATGGVTAPEQKEIDRKQPRNGGKTGEEDELRKQLEEYKQKSEEYFDRLVRLQADFENFRKRVAKEKEQIYQNAACEVLSQFLGILDNMERAFGSININESDCANCRSIGEGIQMIIRQTSNILSRFGVEEIPAEGEKFDPAYHYAVMQVETPDADEGTIVEVLQKGYKTPHKVLRPSMVKVAKKVKEEDAHE